MSPAPNRAELRRARLGLFCIFAVVGASFSSWASRLPSIRSTLDLNESRLGFMLLGVGVGSLVATPIVVRCVGWWGSRTMSLVFSITSGTLVTLIGLAPNQGTFAVVLVAFGAASGGLDVSVNTNGASLERFANRSILGSLHAGFSLGVAGGAGAAAGAAELALSVRSELLILGPVLAVLGVLGTRWCLGDFDSDDRDRARSGRRAHQWRAVWPIVTVTVAAVIAEGSVGDWSALYLADELDVSSTWQSSALLVFSGAMVAGRFGTDFVLRSYAPSQLLAVCGALATMGMGTVVLAPSLPVALLGYAVGGLGLSCAFPSLVAAANRLEGLAPGAGVGAVTASGYAAVLGGPAIIGLVATPIGLRAALTLSVAAAAVVLVIGPNSVERGRRAGGSRHA